MGAFASLAVNILVNQVLRELWIPMTHTIPLAAFPSARAHYRAGSFEFPLTNTKPKVYDSGDLDSTNGQAFVSPEFSIQDFKRRFTAQDISTQTGTMPTRDLKYYDYQRFEPQIRIFVRVGLLTQGLYVTEGNAAPNKINDDNVNRCFFTSGSKIGITQKEARTEFRRGNNATVDPANVPGDNVKAITKDDISNVADQIRQDAGYSRGTNIYAAVGPKAYKEIFNLYVNNSNPNITTSLIRQGVLTDPISGVTFYQTNFPLLYLRSNASGDVQHFSEGAVKSHKDLHFDIPKTADSVKRFSAIQFVSPQLNTLTRKNYNGRADVQDPLVEIKAKLWKINFDCTQLAGIRDYNNVGSYSLIYQQG